MNRSVWLCVVLLTSVLVADAAEAKRRKPPSKNSRSSADAVKIGAEGPSDEQPDRLLALWSDGPATQLRAEAAAALVKAEQAVELLPTDQGEKRKPNFAQVGRAHVALLQLQRITKLLQLWGEPVGFDLAAREKALDAKLGAVKSEFRAAYGKQIDAHQAKFAEGCQQRLKELSQVERLQRADKLEEAERRITELYDDLALEGVWYPARPMSPLWPFQDRLDQVHLAVRVRESNTAKAAVQRFREQQQPDYKALLAEVAEAVSAIAAGRKFESSQGLLDAPQAFGLFLGRWPELHLQALHLRAMNWTGLQDDSRATVHPDREYAEFQKQLATVLCQLIDAEAKVVRPEDVRQHYLDYLQALAATMSLSADKATAQPYAAALERLIQKSPPLAAEVSAYRLATSELLRWRARQAEAQQARNQRAVQPAGAAKFVTHLAEPLPDTMRAMSRERQGWLLVGKNFVGSRETSQATGTSGPQCCCVIRLDERLKEAGASLRGALLVSGALEPLTLEAAMAILCVERGDVVEAGGIVKRLECEGLIPLWAHVGPTAWGFTRLVELPQCDEKFDPLECLRYRVELEPRWYRQQYAYLELKPDNQVSSSDR